LVSYERVYDSLLESICLASPDMNCSICLDETNTDHYIKLHCTHTYHLSCIVDWFHTSQKKNLQTVCPICRTPVLC
jgi:hypothetical protein